MFYSADFTPCLTMVATRRIVQLMSIPALVQRAGLQLLLCGQYILLSTNVMATLALCRPTTALLLHRFSGLLPLLVSVK